MNMNPIALLSEYELRHIIGHLLSSGSSRDLHSLLALQLASGANAWLELRDSRGEITQYLQDIQQASECARSDYASKISVDMDIGPQSAVVLQLQYGLLTAGVTTTSVHISPGLCRRFAEAGVWPERLRFHMSAPSLMTCSESNLFIKCRSW